MKASNLPKVYFPVAMNEVQGLSHGDVFTITPDKTAKNWEMVENKTFVAVPMDFFSNYKANRIWAKAIAKAAREGLNQVIVKEEL